MATTITDYAGLVAIASDLAGDYVLGNDIDASGENFTPLGTFTGTLDGKGHKITELTITINAVGTQSGALIYLNEGTVQNLALEDCAISATSTINARAGAIAVWNTGTIHNCWVTGTIASISGGAWTSSAAGFVVWPSIGGTISESYSLATVTATSPTGTASAGGFAEEIDGTVSDCYARGNASASGGTAYAAGFARENIAGGVITNCFSTGIPTGADGIGGFCQSNADTITDCFWDEDTSGTAVSDGGTGKTTSQMKTKATFTDADWDFIIIWFINGVTNDGYPFHWAMPPEPVESPRETVDIEDKITLECVRNVEMAAGGRFRVDKEGKAVYRSRYARNA